MLDESLLAYIRAERAAGTSKEAIMAQLATGGWTAEDAAAAFAAIEPPAASVKTPSPAEALPPAPTTDILPILGFVREQLAAGVSKKDITDQLATGNWTAQEVAEAFAVIEKTSPPKTVKVAVAAEQSVQAPASAPVVAPAVAPVISAPPAEPTPSTPYPAPAMMPEEPHPVSRVIPLVALAVVLVMIVGTVVAYLSQLGPFAPIVYTLNASPVATSTVPGR